MDKQKIDFDDKIIIGSTIIIAGLGIWFYFENKKLNTSISKLERNIDYLKVSIDKADSQIRLGNRALYEGNDMLKEVVKKMYV